MNDSFADYIELSNGESVENVLFSLLNGEEINKHNSSIKDYIDSWYEQYLLKYTAQIEDNVYCDSRNIISFGGWGPNEESINNDQFFLKFKNSDLTTDLSCPREQDQLAVSNYKAKLKYPIALLQAEEKNNISSKELLKTGKWYWLLSPEAFDGYTTSVLGVYSDGGKIDGYVGADPMGIRPVISLKNGVAIIGGIGTEANPWIIE